MLKRLLNRFMRRGRSADHMVTEPHSPKVQRVNNHLSAAVSYQLVKNYGRVVEECNQALSLDPANAMAYRLRAQANYGLGERDKARADWSRSIQLKQPPVSSDNP